LFDDVKRTDEGRAAHAEPEFSYLNRSAREDVARVRKVLEEWFSRYPVTHQADLAKRFRAPERRGYEAPYLELLLHEMMLRLGFTLVVHPSLFNTTKCPDFLVDGAGTSLFLEAAVVREESEEEAASLKRQALIYDALNELDSPNFFLGVQIREHTKQLPSTRRMRGFLSSELAKLDPDGPLPDGLDFAGDGWRVIFRPIPKTPQSRGATGVGPVGIHSIRTKWVSTREAVRAELSNKAKRYGTMDRPYVVALNVTSEWGCDDDDVVEALFGTQSEVYRPTEGGN
jgi:hypothetical protein